uniref:EGF-like domain-containing protein n=1 Tax=Paramormyrops kingsleyae TaxID=1676925 RepID=A0A3B3QGI5_9TELE
ANAYIIFSFICYCLWVYPTQLDINECLDSFTCPENTMCRNTEGGYLCPCNLGFSSNGSLCEDIDECSTPEQDWLCTNGTCVNTPGSFLCLCEEGFHSANTGCQDVDECADSPAVCGPHSSCLNTIGFYECPCDKGFESNATECTDIDECAKQENLCPAHAECVNTDGHFLCSCRWGTTQSRPQGPTPTLPTSCTLRDSLSWESHTTESM